MDKANRKRNPPVNPARVGVVGLGLMGKSIVACLLGAGHTVTGLDSDKTRRRQAKSRVQTLLKEMRLEGLLRETPQKAVVRFDISERYESFAPCKVVIEAISEDLATKRNVIQKVEQVVSARTLIASNTSAIPISSLQESTERPGRIIGMHWAEPAHVTRFMEIICGNTTSPASAQSAMHWARTWRKEPSLVRKDVRGFITNRISYAMFREACHLVDSGVATIADVDRSLRNDVGYWITFAGPFRYMDLMGVPPYKKVMKDLLPDLDCSSKVPSLMQKLVASGGQGISNGRGFYRYTPAQSKRWEKLFLKFNYEIRELAMKYPEDVGNRPSHGRKTRSSVLPSQRRHSKKRG
jgi:3-hydroxybutyryl-CoA dehydrogenase